jgi:hypothetical protein
MATVTYRDVLAQKYQAFFAETQPIVGDALEKHMSGVPNKDYYDMMQLALYLFPTGRILSMLRLDPEGFVKFTDMLTFECPWEADLAFYLLSYRLAYMEVNRAVQVRGLLSNVGFL